MPDLPSNVPPDIVEADAKVRKWIREQEDKAAQSQPRRDAFERFKRARDIDQSAMPAWKDPRSK
jgi:hypothetical protein